MFLTALSFRNCAVIRTPGKSTDLTPNWPAISSAMFLTTAAPIAFGSVPAVATYGEPSLVMISISAFEISIPYALIEA